MSKAPQQIIQQKLVRYYLKGHRNLPWRSEPTPYRVWISEVMLQQTQVVTVIAYFDRFIKRFKNVRSLARAPLDEVLSLWSGLGYYSRARSLHAAAQLIAQNGFPETREGWEALPGIGPYTAGAILSIAYEKPEAILDGNVERVLSRFYAMKTRSKELLWKKSREWMRRAQKSRLSPSHLNQGLMELGALTCTPKKPKCGICPLSLKCSANLKGEPEKFPVKKVRAKTIKLQESRVMLIHPKKGIAVALNQGKWQKGIYDLPVAQKMKTQLEIEIKYVITNHLIHRKVHIQRVKNSRDYQNWIHLNSDQKTCTPELPITGSLVKSIRQTLVVFAALKPEVLTPSSET